MIATAAPDAPPVVAIAGLTKRFPGVVANDSVSVDFLPGEAHVLLGENGAGKSTLVAILAGLQQPDAGDIRIDGAPALIASPARALELGIGTVFQHAMLVPSLTVAENMALGGPWWSRPRRREIAARIAELAAEIGIAVDPDARVGDLSLGEQQQVEIVRALMRGSRLLILDEATAMLTPKGAEDLGALMRRLVARGIAIVFITHKLNEALAFGDRITVLRLGRKVGALGPEEIAALGHEAATAEIIRLMFGGNTRAADAAPRAPRVTGGRVLAVTALTARGAVPISGIEFYVAGGEILGIAGIDGNGQKELAETLAGQRRATGGSVSLDGTPLDALGVGERRRRGLRHVTDDRLGEGTVGAFPVSLNLLLKQIGSAPFWANGIVRPDPIADHARRLVADFDIRTPSVETPVGKLSGGNIQKALLARELTGDARAIVFSKPTYGLDVQNTRATRARIAEAAAAGLAVLLISTDLEEVLELSDRIAVMDGGRIVGIVPNGSDARERVGRLMSGAPA